MKPIYPMSSDYDGLDQEYQLLQEENRKMATKIEVLEMAVQSMRGTDAEIKCFSIAQVCIQRRAEM